jgi:hypothetical protein
MYVYVCVYVVMQKRNTDQSPILRYGKNNGGNVYSDFLKVPPSLFYTVDWL